MKIWINCWQQVNAFVCVLPQGAGSLRAKFELSNGPSNPSTLAVQFMSDGSTLSGVDMELLGSGYRLSLNKKRFATGRQVHPNVTDTGIINASATQTALLFPLGRYMADCWGDPPLWFWKKNTKQKHKGWQLCEASWTSGSIWAQSGFCPGGENLTTIKQHWVLNTVERKEKNE